MWESSPDSPPRQMQAHAAFSSWSPYAGTSAAGGASIAFGAHLSPAAADSRLPSEDAPDHSWNQTTHSTGAHGSSGYYRGNFLSLLEARNDVTPEMFGDVRAAAACDYLTGVGAAASNMAAGAAYGLGSVDRYSAASVPPVRHETASNKPLLVYSGDSAAHGSYDHEMKQGSHQQVFGAPTAAALLQQVTPSRLEIKSALGYSGMGRSERVRSLTESSFGVGSLPDAGLFCFSEFSSAAGPMSSNNSTHDQEARMGMGSSGSGSGVASVATTRRKPEERVGGNAKKSKQEASRKASPPKSQAPKVKLGEKITALQQIVSPFGKTDTSSVLFETIKYIKFLHEQLRLFSEPYVTKSTYYKGHARFVGEGDEERTGAGHGLRSRGLCLVPVSLTSQVYHDDDTLPDCWTPAYRSCLYYR